MKAASAGKLESLDDDFSARPKDLPLCVFQRLGVEDDERATLHRLGARGKTAAQPPIVEAGVVRAVVGKAPAEHRAVEALGRFDIAGRKLNVVHLEIVLVPLH